MNSLRVKGTRRKDNGVSFGYLVGHKKWWTGGDLSGVFHSNSCLVH